MIHKRYEGQLDFLFKIFHAFYYCSENCNNQPVVDQWIGCTEMLHQAPALVPIQIDTNHNPWYCNTEQSNSYVSSSGCRAAILRRTQCTGSKAFVKIHAVKAYDSFDKRTRNGLLSCLPLMLKSTCRINRKNISRSLRRAQYIRRFVTSARSLKNNSMCIQAQVVLDPGVFSTFVRWESRTTL